MDNKQKTLKSPLSAKNIGDLCNVKCPHCGELATEMFRLELKAQIAGEAQRSIAGEVLFNLEFFKKRTEDTLKRIKRLEKTLKEFMK